MRDRHKECNVAVEKSGTCVECGGETHDLDFAFEAWLCWPECHDKLWAEYTSHCAARSEEV